MCLGSAKQNSALPDRIDGRIQWIDVHKICESKHVAFALRILANCVAFALFYSITWFALIACGLHCMFFFESYEGHVVRFRYQKASSSSECLATSGYVSKPRMSLGAMGAQVLDLEGPSQGLVVALGEAGTIHHGNAWVPTPAAKLFRLRRCCELMALDVTNVLPCLPSGA